MRTAERHLQIGEALAFGLGRLGWRREEQSDSTRFTSPPAIGQGCHHVSRETTCASFSSARRHPKKTGDPLTDGFVPRSPLPGQCGIHRATGSPDPTVTAAGGPLLPSRGLPEKHDESELAARRRRRGQNHSVRGMSTSPMVGDEEPRPQFHVKQCPADTADFYRRSVGGGTRT